MTIIKAMSDALELLESLGYKSGGDIHDNLSEAINTLRREQPSVASTGIMENARDNIEVLVDGAWVTPIKINDKHIKYGWVGYLLADGRSSIAVAGQWKPVEHG